MMKKKILLTACLMTACSMGLNAGEWQTIGAKGVGMGGAQVAIPEGSQAVSINPAALAKEQRFDIALPISVTVGSEGDIIESLDSLEKTYSGTVETALDNLNTGSAATKGANFKTVSDFITVTAKNKLDKSGQGILANANSALTARWKRFGFSAGIRAMAAGTVTYDSTFSLSSTGGGFFDSAAATQVQGEATAAPAVTDATTLADAKTVHASTTQGAGGLTEAQVAYYVDQLNGTSNAALTTEQKSLLTAVANDVNGTLNGGTARTTTDASAKIVNGTGLVIRGIQIKEFAVAYGFSFQENKLHIAPSIKMMKGETFASSITLTDTADDNKDIGDELDNDTNTVNSTEFTLDVGVIYQVNEKVTLGLMGKDLTSPSFKVAGSNEIKLDPSLRFGSAYEYTQKPGWRGVIAADLDLIESDSAVLIGGSSQQFALGVSQELMGWLSLRAGLNKNLAGESSGLSYSAGLGIQISKFYLDLAGSTSSDEVTVDGDDFPTRGGFGATIGWNMNF